MVIATALGAGEEPKTAEAAAARVVMMVQLRMEGVELEHLVMEGLLKVCG